MDLIHKRYFRTNQNEPYYFYLSSAEIEDDIKWIDEHKIENIRLSQYGEYSITSIEAIFKIKTVIKRLVIFIENIDLNRLAELKELEELGIGEPAKNINLSSFKKLKKLYLVHTKKIIGFASLQALEELIILKAPSLFFSAENFNRLTNLNSLTILSGKIPQQLDFLLQLTNLKELEIHNIKSTFSVAALRSLENIEILKIGCCPCVNDLITTLPLLKHLTWLALTDSSTLDDTSFIESLPNLKVLVVLGKSYFKNGDLSNLKNKLEHVGIDNKRHYNLKYEDFQK